MGRNYRLCLFAEKYAFVAARIKPGVLSVLDSP